MTKLHCWSLAGALLRFPPVEPYVAGILNMTPDSFSDGGRYPTVADALDRAMEMAEAGADIIDVGGQSTRPGFKAVSLREEEERVLPLLEALRPALEKRAVLISLDTDKPELAEKVLRLGLADILNDESGGNPDMAVAAAACRAPLILMHRPETETRGSLPAVMEDLETMRRSYVAAGLDRDLIALDPGLGFGKTHEENMDILRHCRQLLRLGSPVYIGASRKRFVGKATGVSQADRRLGGSVAAALWAAREGAAFVRVHDVAETAEALRMNTALFSAVPAENGPVKAE